jgi:hypothetical protein
MRNLNIKDNRWSIKDEWRLEIGDKMLEIEIRDERQEMKRR